MGGRQVNASLFLSARKYFSHSELAKSISDPPTLPLKDQPLAFIHLELIT
jgi:hypothetical protein